MAPKLAAATPPSPDRGLDRIDRRLLVRLQQDGRTPVSQLAREVHLTVTPTLERVRRLESSGYIEGYFARSVAEGWGAHSARGGKRVD